MPTNKLWIEHTERAAWDSVQTLREQLSKAEARLQALTKSVERMPELLSLIDEARQRYAPEAKDHGDVVNHLTALVEHLRGELVRAKAPAPTLSGLAVPPPKPPQYSEDQHAQVTGLAEDEEFDALVSFTQTMRRRSQEAEPADDLNRLLFLLESKVDDLTDLEGSALRGAAVELALLAAKIHAASRG
jgi:hypothetical protein